VLDMTVQEAMYYVDVLNERREEEAAAMKRAARR
jgi:hypothetical protein